MHRLHTHTRSYHMMLSECGQPLNALQTFGGGGQRCMSGRSTCVLLLFSLLLFLLLSYCIISSSSSSSRSRSRSRSKSRSIIIIIIMIIIIIIIISSSSSSSTQRIARRPVDEMHVFTKKCSRLGQKQLVKSTSMQKHTFLI